MTVEIQRRHEAYAKRLRAEIREDCWTAEQKEGMRWALKWFSKIVLTGKDDGDSGKAPGHTRASEGGAQG